MEERLNDLKSLEMMFSGTDYIGGHEYNKDFYVPVLDIRTLSDNEWEIMIGKMKKELQRRKDGRIDL